MANTKSRVLVGVADIEIRYPVGGAWVDAGYTVDGVIWEGATETFDVRVEEETMPIERVVTGETVAIIVNMAEGSLFNIDKAIPGSVLAAATISIGDGVIKEMSIRVTGTTPTGGTRTITLPLCTAVGTVSTPYTKGGIQVVPARFEALKGAGAGCTIVDT